MDAELIQRTRYLLQARGRTAKSCPRYVFITACRHLAVWIRTEPLTAGLTATLAHAAKPHAIAIAEIAAAFEKEEPTERPTPKFATTEELAAASLAVLDALALANEIDDAGVDAAFVYLTSRRPTESWDAKIDCFRDIAINSVLGHIDERIDQRNVTLAVLRRYKARSELFRAHRLRAIARDGFEGRLKGERSLAVDLYEYLADQGIEFVVEPTLQAAGMPDAVVQTTNRSRTIIDAKWIERDAQPHEMCKRVVDGFSQVLAYCRRLDESVGYLIVFTASKRQLDLDHEDDDTFPVVRTSGRSVYYVVIDIAEAPSASKLGPTEIVRVTRDEIVAAADLLSATAPTAPP